MDLCAKEKDILQIVVNCVCSAMAFTGFISEVTTLICRKLC